MTIAVTVPEVAQMPREPRGIFTSEGRREIASLLVWGSSENAHFDRIQIQRRIEAFLERYAKGVIEGKYGTY